MGKRLITPPVSTIPVRALVGFMALNHVTCAVALTIGYSPWRKGSKKLLYNTSGKEATLFNDADSAAVWVDRTIIAGRLEWKAYCADNGVADSDWRKSSWRWLHRQTWSIVPVFRALPSEHKESR